MNKQRKVLITITYNEMGIIIDTKTEELGSSAQLGTNLAEVGTDCISREQAINALDECYCGGEDSCGEPWIYKENAVEAIQMIEPIPSAQPEIIRCRECKFASGDSRICMKFDHSPIGELDFCSFAERREVNNESN